MPGFQNITVTELQMMLQQDGLRLVEVRARHGEAEPSGAGEPASHLLPQSAGCASNVSKVRARHGEAEPSGAGEPASHLLPQSAGCAITSDLASVVGSPSRMAITNDLPSVFCWVSQMASSFISSFISNVSKVRTDAEVARGKIPQGDSLPLHLISMRLHKLDKTVPTVFYCQMGGRSAQAAAVAAASDFADVYNLQGGIAAWVHAGLPVSA